MLLLLCLAAIAWPGAAAKLLEIEVEGAIRTAWVHVPDNADPSSLLPVVIAFHGSTWNGRVMEQVTGFSSIANRERFIAVYPNGTGPADILSWNATYCCSFALEHQTDDLLFVDRLLETLVSRYPVDENRIYATGFSNGAMLTYVLAIQRPERFAAIAPVAGAMYPSQQQVSVPVPIMILHGTKDVVIPYTGGWGALGALSGRKEPAMPVSDAVAFWLSNNQCSQDPVPPVTERNARIETYDACGNQSEVVLITLIDGEHVWPTVHSNTSEFLLTADATELLNSLSIDSPTGSIPWDLFETGIDASEKIWDFFSGHHR